MATGLVDVPDLPGRVTAESGNQRGSGLFGSDQHPRLRELDELAAQFLANPFSWLTSDPVVDGGVDDSGPEGVDGDARVGEFGGQVRLSTFLPEHAAVWDRIVAKHNLRPITMDKLVGESHHYADLLFRYGAEAPPTSILVSTIKLRQAGFGDCVDTEVMFDRWLRRIADRGIIPQPGA